MRLLTKLFNTLRVYLCEDIIEFAIADAIDPEGWLWEEDEIGGIVIDIAYAKGYEQGLQDAQLQTYMDNTSVD